MTTLYVLLKFINFYGKDVYDVTNIKTNVILGKL